MKSIKQQYIDLTEGRMSQANFMRNLRMMMPQHITNVTSFNDSVKILKNKGILSEAEMKKYTDKEIQAKYNEMFGRNPQTKFADVAKALGISEDEVNMALRSMTPSGMSMPMREAKDEKTKWTNTSGKSMYDQFSEINNLNGQEVLIGIDAEMEKNHELTKEEATKIVIKNLKKNPIYYTAEYMSGVEGYEPEYLGGKSAQPEARQMQPLDKNMGNVVDKKMGMQPVKDVEKAKKDSDAATAQKYKTSGISLMSLVAKTVRGVKKMDPTGEKMKKITMKENFDPEIEGEDSPGYKDFLARKEKEEELNKSYNGLRINTKVIIDPNFAEDAGFKKSKIYTIKSFSTSNQSTNANFEEGGSINIKYLMKALIN